MIQLEKIHKNKKNRLTDIRVKSYKLLKFETCKIGSNSFDCFKHFFRAVYGSVVYSLWCH